MPSHPGEPPLVPGIAFSPPPQLRFRRSLWAPTLGALAVSFLIHAGLLAAIVIYENGTDTGSSPPQEETPVEVVMEPPPDAPPVPKPEQSQPPPQQQARLDETIATDAPRSGKDEIDERNAPDRAMKAPVRAPPTARGPAPQKPAPAPPMPEDARPSLEPETDDAPVDARPDAEVIRPANMKHDKPQPPTPKAGSEKSIGEQLAAMEFLPDVQFGAASKKSPVGGGNAKSTYLSILYGMIVAHMNNPPGVQAGLVAPSGEIAFLVDGSGRVIQRQVVRSSGFPTLDLAAMNAIAVASPFPKPPGGYPIGLTFVFNAK